MRTKTAQLCLLAGLAVTTVVAGPLHPAPALAANGDTMKFTLDEVVFSGNARVTTDKLNSVVGLSPGDKVDRDDIVAAFGRIQDEYSKENVGGSIQPTISPPKKGHITVTFNISEAAAPVAKVVPLMLDHETATGNKKVTNAQLATALTIKPGDTVTTDKVKADLDAVGAIYKGAGIGVAINPKVTYPTPGHVDLNYEIVENPPQK